MHVSTGLDLIAKRWPKKLAGARAGLLVHPASVDVGLRHAADVAGASRSLKLAALFGPQHGIRGETQDNMVEWQSFRDKKTGLPAYSLYSNTRKPTPDMLKGLDVMIMDMQDVGARYYTFIWTMDLCMEACRESGVSVVVLDRPNPIGGNLIEGPVLDPAYSSFVGLRPLPVRHGMTVGEIALYLRENFHPQLDLHVLRMNGWKRDMWFDCTGLPWVMPSPNMPTLETAAVYPGMCLLEGTMLSEGRGTTRPFEIFGAPHIDPDILLRRLKEFKLPGAVFRPMHFQPTFQKHAGRTCGGAQIHITDREKFRPFKTGIAVLKTVLELYPAYPLWKLPPYEYETEKMPVDILMGSGKLREDIEQGVELKTMEAWWQEQCRRFQRTVRKNYVLYG